MLARALAASAVLAAGAACAVDPRSGKFTPVPGH